MDCSPSLDQAAGFFQPGSGQRGPYPPEAGVQGPLMGPAPSRAEKKRQGRRVTGGDGSLDYPSHMRARAADNLFWRHHASPMRIECSRGGANLVQPRHSYDGSVVSSPIA
jgi:hypothetical protein